MKCPFCAEEIQDEAKKCKHCGEWLDASLKPESTSEPELSEPELSESESEPALYECYVINVAGQWVKTVQLVGKNEEELAAAVKNKYGPELYLHPDKKPVKVSDRPSQEQIRTSEQPIVKDERGGCGWVLIIAGGIILAVLALSFM